MTRAELGAPAGTHNAAQFSERTGNVSPGIAAILAASSGRLLAGVLT
jgi:hypothetical protein